MFKFRHADPNSRIPTYLQPFTVENLKWQVLFTLPALILAMKAYDEMERRMTIYRYNQTHPSHD